MIDLKALQKRVYANKVAKHFNVTDIYMEFCYAYGELAEASDAYIKKMDTVGEELADVVLYLLGLSEILGIDLEKELLRKIDINEKRKYIQQNGVNIRLEG
ncbi:MAG: hypothetical protein FWD78_01400 [Treponema sp.]|nr:hypothetical protein [Treponema sp.]